MQGRSLTLVALVAVLLAASSASAQDIVMRPIDRATLRVIGVSGMGISTGTGRITGVRRVGADPSIGHGSGVAIGPRLILTARHVVWAMSAYAVVLPGVSEPIPARPVYVDLEQDIAFLVVDQDLPHYLSLPAVRRLAMSEPVSVSGYPLDLREPNPAASSGEVSRIARDGLLHLTLSANPGNSGGPVIDRAGRIIGIVSMRGRPQAGVEGLTIAVPLPMILAARARVPDERPRFLPYEEDLARAIALVAALADERLHDERAEIHALVSRARQHTEMVAEHALIFASLAWNTALSVMEAEGATGLEDVGPANRGLVTTLHTIAVEMARGALTRAPHVRRGFPAARPIAIGRVAPFGAAVGRTQ